MTRKSLSRRGFMTSSGTALLCSLATGLRPAQAAQAAPAGMAMDHALHPGFRDGRIADPHANGFDPAYVVRDFDWGRARPLAGGRMLREWELVAADKTVELTPGTRFPAWTFN